MGDEQEACPQRCTPSMLDDGVAGQPSLTRRARTARRTRTTTRRDRDAPAREQGPRPSATQAVSGRDCCWPWRRSERARAGRLPRREPHGAVVALRGSDGSCGRAVTRVSPARATARRPALSRNPDAPHVPRRSGDGSSSAASRRACQLLAPAHRAATGARDDVECFATGMPREEPRSGVVRFAYRSLLADRVRHSRRGPPWAIDQRRP
jgi:hypothetical protein